MASDDEMSPRQLARRKTRQAGDRSARLARELMSVAEWMLAKLELDEELLGEITRARAVTAMVARRRAERTLAGALRQVDLATLRDRLASVRATGSIDADRQHVAERWRARLLDGGAEALAAFTGDGEPDHALPGMIAQALRERATGKPPGAGRALFRHIMEELKARAAGGARGGGDARDELGGDEAGDDEVGDDELGDDERGDDEAGDDEAGDDGDELDGDAEDDDA